MGATQSFTLQRPALPGFGDHAGRRPERGHEAEPPHLSPPATPHARLQPGSSRLPLPGQGSPCSRHRGDHPPPPPPCLGCPLPRLCSISPPNAAETSVWLPCAAASRGARWGQEATPAHPTSKALHVPASGAGRYSAGAPGTNGLVLPQRKRQGLEILPAAGFRLARPPPPPPAANSPGTKGLHSQHGSSVRKHLAKNHRQQIKRNEIFNR